MLGRCVVEKSLPLHDFIPNAPLHPDSIVQDICPQGVEYTDISRVLETAVDATVKTKFTDMFKAAISQRDTKDLQITAGTVTLYDMLNPGNTLKTLMTNSDYQAQLLAKMIIQEKKRNKTTEFKVLPMVVGLLTCKGLEFGFEIENNRGTELQGKLPVGEATSTPNTLDPEIEFKRTDERSDHFEGKINEEVIFAVAYDEVRLASYLLKRGWKQRLRSQHPVSPPELKAGPPIRTRQGFNVRFSGSEEVELDEEGEDDTSSTYTVPPSNTGNCLPFVLCYDDAADENLLH